MNIAFDSYLDAGLPYFTVDNLSYKCYMHKASAGIWDLYVYKQEAYDEIGVVDLHFPSYLKVYTSITWTDDQVSTLPSDCIQAWLETCPYTYADVGAAAENHSHSNYIPALSFNSPADCNTQYNIGYRGIASGSNCPSGNQYGSLFTMPYRTGNSNSSPDFATQIFIPNGDDSKNPDDMFFRTSQKDSWRSWNKVWTNNNLKFSLSGSTLTITTT